MRLHILAGLLTFLAAGCFADARIDNDSSWVKSETRCISLAGEYGVARDFEDSYFVSLAVGQSMLDVTFGLADNYQPIIKKGVNYHCVSDDELAFSFQDDVGNEAVGRLHRQGKGFRLEFDVDESPSDDFVRRNSRRNYGSFELMRL